MALEKIRPRVVDETGNYTFNNVTTTGTLVSVNANLGNLARANFFSTDNLLYANGTAYNIGAGSVVGADTQVQYNDGGSAFGAKSTFTFTKSTDTLTVTNITANGAGLTSLTGANVTGTVANATYATSAGTATTATTSGTVTTNAQPNITSVGSLTSLTVTGNLVSGNANLGNSTSSNYYLGNGFFLTSIPGGNVLGQVTYAGTANSVAGSNVVGGVIYASTANAVAGANVMGQVGNALIAETVTTNAQPNITSVGTLTSLGVTGNVSANYYIGNGSQLTGITISGAYSNTNTAAYLPTYTGNVSANYFIGNGSTLTNITGANITGNAPFAGTANYANTANSITGTNVSGQVGNALVAGTVYTAAQTNITSVGTLTSLTVSGNVTGGNLIATGKVYASDIINGGTGIYLAAGPSGYINFFTSTGDKVSIKDNGNIDVVGTANVGNLITSGNITSGNANLGNLATANYFSGNGSLLTSVGNVSGPSSSTDNAIVRFDLTTGKLIQNSLVTIADDGSITAPGVGSIIPFYFANQASFPSASTYHGAVAHSHADGKMFFAHGGSWVELVDISSSQTLSNKTITSSPSVTVTGNITSGNANLGNAVTANYFIGNGSLLTGLTGTNYGNSNVAEYLPTYTGNVNANFFVGSGVYVTGVAAATAAIVTTNAQPHITSVGTLSSLIIGNATANTTFGNGTITATGNISFTGSNVNLGSVNNIKITGGTAGYLLSTDGAGSLSWGAAAGGGGASVTGSNTQIQFNDGGVLGASANLVFDKTTNTFTTGRVIASAGANLGANVSNLYVGGGGASQILSTDGSGNLTWIAQPTAVITVDNFTGNGAQTVFTLSTTPASINQTVVNYNGAFQLRSAYTLTGPNITFSEAPANGSLIEVTTTMGATSGAGAFVTRTYTGNGVATTYTVTSGVTVSSVLVTENGLVQTPTVDYTIAGSTLTFVAAPASNVAIQIRELAISIATTNAPVYRSYTGNGVANTFTITSGLSANSLIVAENGIIQRPTTDYSVSGSNVVFVNAPASNVDIQIRELSLNGGGTSSGISLPTQGGNSGKYLTTDGATTSWANVSVGGSVIIKEEGSNLTTAVTSIDFVGAGVTASNTGNAVTVTVSVPDTLSPFLLMGA